MSTIVIRTFKHVEVDKPVRFITKNKLQQGDVVELADHELDVYGAAEVFLFEGPGKHDGELVYHAKRTK